MTRLRRLVNIAKQAMEFRQHKPGKVWYSLIKDQNGRSVGARIKCIGCDKAAHVTVYPQPNEIDIAGEAVALNCTFFAGSVSTDTMNPIYLIRAFLPLAEKLFTGKEDRDELFRIRERDERPCGWQDTGDDWLDRLNEDFDFLVDGLNTCAPKYMYFGAHPDDGANYGFWDIPH